MNKVKLNLKAAIIMALLIFLIIGCEKQIHELETTSPEVTSEYEIGFKTGDYCVVDLLAGQTINVGTVTTEFISSDMVLITYTITNPDWGLIKIHLDVQIDPINFPQNKKGNPKLGQFAYVEDLECASTWTETINLSTVLDWEEGMTIYIAAHAEVINQLQEDESVWGEGVSFSGNKKPMYFDCVPPCFECGDPLIDERDGQTYNTVEIGSQTWMAENLNYETTNSWWYNNSSANGDVYGRLYTWNAARTACPSGWHLPSDEEWKILEMYLGMSQEEADDIGYRGTDEGTKLKSTSGWIYGNGTDEVSFTGLPGAFRNDNGYFSHLGYWADWWSATDYSSERAWHRDVEYGISTVRRSSKSKAYGFSIRCLRD